MGTDLNAVSVKEPPSFTQGDYFYMDDFSETIEEAENCDSADIYDRDFYDEYAEEAFHGAVEATDMTEEEAFGIYDLAFALGLGDEIGLDEAEHYRMTAEMAKAESFEMASDLFSGDEEAEHPISLRNREIFNKNGSSCSSLTGKPKCPFEQWIKDVATGRKSIHDPVGGDNSYGCEP
jgi:hypothetical protein